MKRKHRLFLLLLCLALGAPLWAQLPGLQNSNATAPPAAAADSLGRTSPRATVYEFLAAAERGNYLRASEYLDLRALSGKGRRPGMDLALQLYEVLNHDTDFDVQSLSDSADGKRGDLRDANRELVAKVDVDGSSVPIELERVEVSPNNRVWVFSSDTVAAIPTLKTILGESPFEKHLPEPLVRIRFVDTALWQWIALIVLIPALGFLGRLLSRATLGIARRFVRNTPQALESFGVRKLVGPIGLLLGVAAYGAGMSFVGPSALVRFFVSRILTLLAFMAIAWIAMRVLEILATRIQFVSDARQQALYSSVMPLALRVGKILIFVVAVVATISAWGYNTNTIWATLGLGSLAVALAAQKTLENFFGGVSVIGDRPVLVGDFCKVGDQVGTVEDIGLRSTRIRTLSRTLVTVPNSQFSTMTLENYSFRDKMWFHPALGLRCDATPAQLRRVMASLEQILQDHPEVDVGKVPVRFVGIGDYSYNLEIFAYVRTADFDHFLEVQSELLLKMLEAIEKEGTGLAVPVREVTGSVTPVESQPPATARTDGRPSA